MDTDLTRASTSREGSCQQASSCPPITRFEEACGGVELPGCVCRRVVVGLRGDQPVLGVGWELACGHRGPGAGAGTGPGASAVGCRAGVVHCCCQVCARSVRGTCRQAEQSSDPAVDVRGIRVADRSIPCRLRAGFQSFRVASGLGHAEIDRMWRFWVCLG